MVVVISGIVLIGCIILLRQLNNSDQYKLIARFVPRRDIDALCEATNAWQLQDVLRDEDGNQYYLINVDRGEQVIYVSAKDNKNRRYEIDFREYLAKGMTNEDFDVRQERLRRQLKEKAIQKKLESLDPLPVQVSMTRNLLAMGTDGMSDVELHMYSEQLQVAQDSDADQRRTDLDDGINQLEWAYMTLGFERDSVASPNEIQKKYRQLSKLYHPDVASSSDLDGHTKKFTEINRAYDILTKNY